MAELLDPLSLNNAHITFKQLIYKDRFHLISEWTSLLPYHAIFALMHIYKYALFQRRWEVDAENIICGTDIPNVLPSESIALSLNTFPVPDEIPDGTEFMININQKVEVPSLRFISFQDMKPPVPQDYHPYCFGLITSAENCIITNIRVRTSCAIKEQKKIAWSIGNFFYEDTMPFNIIATTKGEDPKNIMARALKLFKVAAIETTPQFINSSFQNLPTIYCTWKVQERTVPIAGFMAAEIFLHFEQNPPPFVCIKTEGFYIEPQVPKV